MAFFCGDMSQLPAISPHYNSRLSFFAHIQGAFLVNQTPRFTSFQRLLLPVFCAICLFSGEASASAESVRSFVPGALAKIVGARQGKPFILALWSISCTHCPAELKALGQLKNVYPKLDIVLVAADSLEDAPQAAATARGYGLAHSSQWIFADPMPERLRFEIDRRWHGELPRTYLYDRQHKVQGFSGLVPAEQLAQWIKENLQ